MSAALSTEVLKLRRSRMWWTTLLAFTVAAAVAGLFMFIGQDPRRARSLGLLGTKAQLAGMVANWDGFFAMLAQIVAVGGSLVFGMLSIWVFGREFSDNTVQGLLALPTSRTAIVLAKFAATSGWCAVLTGYLLVVGLALGTVLRLPGWSTEVAARGLGTVLVTAALTILVAPVFALAASVGHGYLPAIGVLFVTVFLSQIIAVLGYGASFPFSVPALYSGIAGPDQTSLGALSYLLVIAVTGITVPATLTWWRCADHHG